MPRRSPRRACLLLAALSVVAPLGLSPSAFAQDRAVPIYGPMTISESGLHRLTRLHLESTSGGAYRDKLLQASTPIYVYDTHLVDAGGNVEY